MIRINLLPHRQIKRAERQRQFNLMLVATIVAAGAFVFMGWSFIDSRIQNQQSRNARLEKASAELDKQIEEIKDLKDQINAVLERKQIVENLQTNRSQAVVILDEISRQLPEGTYIKSIKQQGSTISLQGVADTNARVASLVSNFSASEWVTSPNLIEIKAITINNIKSNEFLMTVKLKAPQTPDADNMQDEKPQKKSKKGGKS